MKTCTNEKAVESFSSLGCDLTPLAAYWARIKRFKKNRSNTAKNSCYGLSALAPAERNGILKALFDPTFSHDLGLDQRNGSSHVQDGCGSSTWGSGRSRCSPHLAREHRPQTKGRSLAKVSEAAKAKLPGTKPVPILFSCPLRRR